jgi:hypothetical protein
VPGISHPAQSDPPRATERAITGPRSDVRDERARARRRRFALRIAPVAVLLIVAGVLLGSGSGVLHAVGLAAIAYGIGLGVALTWLAAGRNPVAQR